VTKFADIFVADEGSGRATMVVSRATDDTVEVQHFSHLDRRNVSDFAKALRDGGWTVAVWFAERQWKI